MKNYTLSIDEESRDLVFDKNGDLELVESHETTAQNIRLTLLAWLEDFPLDLTHGTNYKRLFMDTPSPNRDEIQAIFRDAIFQEPEVLEINALDWTIENRQITMNFAGNLRDGTAISMEVTQNGY
jgi:hypothetical protein